MTPPPLRCAVNLGRDRIEYTLVRSPRRRRTIGITLDDAGQVVVRAPLRASRAVVDDVVRRKAAWIARRKREASRSSSRPRLPEITPDQRAVLVEQARLSLEAAVQRWAPAVGRRPTGVLVRNQKRLWGSCSRDGTLRFNWRLALLDPSLLDYVVVHELVHLRVKNHQRDFWSAVAAVLPDYRERRAGLKRGAWALSMGR